jgi:DNA (cytosine-5)-methyltransferase 1
MSRVQDFHKIKQDVSDSRVKSNERGIVAAGQNLLVEVEVRTARKVKPISGNRKKHSFTSLEVCAGAGGQAVGLEKAGFDHVALVEIEERFCDTLRLNRPQWNVIQADLNQFDGSPFHGLVDLVAGGVPCPPFSKAGKQLGQNDERDLFPAALRLVREVRPKAVMIENVRGLLDPKFADYRALITRELEEMGYKPQWKLLHAAHFGVPQLRPRTLMVALQEPYAQYFEWPEGTPDKLVSVGEALHEYMVSAGWKGADAWREKAAQVAPTLVGGSKKHGGADLGPTRAKAAWRALGVDGHGLADSPPSADFDGLPRLTAQMAAVVQGFPKVWKFAGKKTAAYRQIGNAFPPPVAAAVGKAVHKALARGSKLISQALPDGKIISSLARVS